MTVAALRAEIPQAEYVQWGVYYGRQAQQAELEAAKVKAGAGRG